MRDRIKSALSSEFNVEVIDDSNRHQGHVGNTLSSESHFIVIVYLSVENNDSSLNIHKRMYQLLEEIMPKIHALSIEVKRNENSR